MTERKVVQDRSNRTCVFIPAYLRDKYGLEKGTIVDVNDDGKSIVITPLKEQ